MKLAGALWLLAAALVLGVGAELVWPATYVPEPATAPRPAGSPPAAAAEPYGAWTTAILARPLFNPGRRPVAPAAAAAAAPETRQEPPRLTGILVTPQGSHAIFAAGEGERATIAGEGMRVGGWQVTAIRAGEVQLSGPDGARIVRPSYANAPPLATVVSPLPGFGVPNGLLPPLPQTDTRPFNSIAEPSGAAIFQNTPRQPAARAP